MNKKTKYFLLFIFSGFCFAANVSAQNIITIAGGIGDNLPAVKYARLNTTQIDIDASGTIYLADCGNLRVRKISPSGIITTIAGNGESAYAGIGGSAVTAAAYIPYDVATDPTGNVYVAFWDCIAKIDLSGVLTIVAGNHSLGNGFSGDGGPATNAQIESYASIALYAAGNLYIADRGNDRIRKVTPSGLINTIAGGGALVGDGGPAIMAKLNQPTDIVVDAIGNIFIANLNSIRKVNPSGIITTVVIDSFMLSHPQAIDFDATGNLYIADRNNYRILKVDTTGKTKKIAGTGVFGFSGDGGPATVAMLTVTDVKVDNVGNVYFVDTRNRIRMINTAGIVSTVAGNGVSVAGFEGDGNTASLGVFNNASGLCAGIAGDIYVADNNNNRVRKIDRFGIVSTIAGYGITGFNGDRGPATAAFFDSPIDVAADPSGKVYISDKNNNRIRVIDASGIVTTFAGGGLSGLGDGGPATAATTSVHGIAVDHSYNVYIADNAHHRIRKVTSTGIINTIAGTGIAGFNGDGGPATAANIFNPTDVAVDNKGNIFFAGDNHIRKIDSTGIISTLDTGYFASITADNSGNIYYRNRFDIIKIDPFGTSSVFAGSGVRGVTGDLGPATSAQLRDPSGLAIDGSGHLLIADNTMIRCVGCTPYEVLSAPATPANPANSPYRISPNPATNQLTISWIDQMTKDAEVSISTLSGKQICKTAISTRIPNGTITLDISDISTGVYIVSIVSAENNYQSQLIILK